MGRQKKFTAESLAEKWEEYKQYCDSQTVIRTEFSQRKADFITRKIPSPITYTIKGFALYCGMTERNFYKTYGNDEKFQSVIARMKEECEQDARRKFENGSIPTQLSGLWMSNYGYSTNQNQKINADADLNIHIDYGENDGKTT